MKKLVSLLVVLTFLISGFSVSYGKETNIKYAESDEELSAVEKSILSKINNSKRDIKNVNINSVKEAREMLEKDDYPIDEDFAELCGEIEDYKATNKYEDIKLVVKHFNTLSGLKEKPKSKIKISFSFGKSVHAISYDSWAALTTREKLLAIMYPAEALIVNSCSQTAYTYTKDKFGYNGLGDKSDGYRHAIWNALMDAGKYCRIVFHCS